LRCTKDKKRFTGTSDALALVCMVRIANVPTCPAAPLFNLTDTIAEQPQPLSVAGGRPIPAGMTGAVIARQSFGVALRIGMGKFTYRAAVEFDVVPASLLYASVETGFRSGGFDYLTVQRIGGRWTSNAQLSFGPNNDTWSIAAFVRNIQNDRVLTFLPTANSGAFVVAYTSDPRRYGVRVGLKF
jgi:outer membrane receptor protein involved in Fe transport